MARKGVNLAETGSFSAQVSMMQATGYNPSSFSIKETEQKKEQEQEKQTSQIVIPNAAKKEKAFASVIKKVDPRACVPWRLHDRSDDNIDHVADISASIIEVDQIHPCTVRMIDHTDARFAKGIVYEIIAGKVRWLSALQNNKQLDVVIKDLDDLSALKVMADENLKRKSINDWDRANHLKKVWSEGLFKTKGEMAKFFGLANQELSYYFKFAQLDAQIVELLKNVLPELSYRVGDGLVRVWEEGNRAELIELCKIVKTASDLTVQKLLDMKNRESVSEPVLSVPPVSDSVEHTEHTEHTVPVSVTNATKNTAYFADVIKKVKSHLKKIDSATKDENGNLFAKTADGELLIVLKDVQSFSDEDLMKAIKEGKTGEVANKISHV